MIPRPNSYCAWGYKTKPEWQQCHGQFTGTPEKTNQK